MANYDWMDHAACLDGNPNDWFPSTPGRGNSADAEAVCASCPVQGACRDFARRTGSAFGIWGGEPKLTKALGSSGGGPNRTRRVPA